MRIVLQRVTRAHVSVSGEIVGSIGPGLVLLIGLAPGDTVASFPPIIEKILNMRIFPDERGRFHHSARDVAADLLLVSQFTLFADLSKGRRPEFSGAMDPAQARDLFALLVDQFRASAPARIESGVFGAMMQVDLVNDGPVTILIDDSTAHPS